MAFSIDLEGIKAEAHLYTQLSRFTMVRAPTLALLAVGLLAANSLTHPLRGKINSAQKEELMVSGIPIDITSECSGSQRHYRIYNIQGQ